VVLARNAYRFALLLTGYGIASGIDDLGAYSAEGPALLGLGLGGLALLAGTLTHYASGSNGPGDDGDGVDHGRGGRPGVTPDDTTDRDGENDSEAAAEQSAPRPQPTWGGRW
jgi:hypothetical protein